MITIEASPNAGYFRIDGIDYPKNMYYLKYDNKEGAESERNFSLYSIIDHDCILKSRGYAEITGATSWFELLYILSNLSVLASNDVAIQDQATEIIDLHLSELIQEVTLINGTNIDDKTITVSSVAEPTNGNIICLKENTAFYQGEILSHAANGLNWDITLDMPLDFAFTVAGGCSERNDNAAVNGSITPRIFSISPSNLNNAVVWDITRILGLMLDNDPMDDGKFGGLTKLTNGVLLRNINGVTKNIFSATSNGDLRAHCYDVSYADKAPAGQYGMSFRRTFAGQEKNGVVIRLHAITNDELQFIVQDDLSGLIQFQLVVQGHIVSI